ncbi:peptidoglycan editing factor PgeF [Metabacillus malikii]
MEPFKQFNESLLIQTEWQNHVEGLIVGSTTRNGGVSTADYSSLNLGLHVQDSIEKVVENRKIVADTTSIMYDGWTFAEQVHGHHIEKITTENRGKGFYSYDEAISKCDGFYTSEKGIILALCFADCVPVYFLEPSRKVVGIAHAGWRGTVENICGKFIDIWKNDELILPENIKVTIGPSISDCCYIVDEKVISEINKMNIQHINQSYEKITDNEYKLNLKELNKYLLLNAGIKNENITISQYCTCCEEDLFFSHRRDKGKTGRMLSFIGINREA